MNEKNWAELEKSLMWEPLPMPQRVAHAQKIAERAQSLLTTPSSKSHQHLNNLTIEDFHRLVNPKEDAYKMMERAVYDFEHRNESYPS